MVYLSGLAFRDTLHDLTYVPDPLSTPLRKKHYLVLPIVFFADEISGVEA